MFAEQFAGTGFEQIVGLDGTDDRRIVPLRSRHGAGHAREGVAHRVEGMQDVAFAAAQRGQPVQGQLVLQIAQIVLAQGKVMGQVGGAAPSLAVHRVTMFVQPSDAVGQDLGVQAFQRLENQLQGRAFGFFGVHHVRTKACIDEYCVKAFSALF